MYHYVYRLDLLETGEFYFGSRSCKCIPIEDKYMGSMVRWKPNKSSLIKTILNDKFQTRSDAIDEEAKLISDNINNPLIRNYYIPNKNFHTTGWGYWTGKVGPHTGYTHSDEVKERQRQMLLGTKHSVETKVKMSISHKGLVKTLEHRRNLSKSLSGVAKTEKHKASLSDSHKIPIIQYDINGNFIKEWAGIIDAQRTLGINHIPECCKGKNKTAGGYKWSYK